VRKRVPKTVGKVAEGAMLGGASLVLGHWAGHDGLSLILATSIAIRDINGAVGRRGGIFDRLLKTIENVAAKKPAVEIEKKKRRGKARKKASAKSAPHKTEAEKPRP
jgi:hypothetical protein